MQFGGLSGGTFSEVFPEDAAILRTALNKA
jgi:hypothetical protein